LDQRVTQTGTAISEEVLSQKRLAVFLVFQIFLINSEKVLQLRRRTFLFLDTWA